MLSKIWPFNKGRSYDVFISYKSQDVSLARQVADQLIASGHRVWFAEYQILLQARERFQEAIDKGISASKYGIIFTNNRYIGSVYCCREVEGLLRHLEPDRILEIKIPDEEMPHKCYPGLARCPGFSSAEINEILDFLSSSSDLSPGRVKDPTAGREKSDYQGICMGSRFFLDTTGWTLEQRGEVGMDGSHGGLSLKLEATDFPIFANLYAGPELSPRGQRLNQDLDDREMYNELIEYAPGFLSKLGAKAVGVHLLFHHGLSQFGLTYKNRGFLFRKISLIIPNPASEFSTEFVFTFAVAGPPASYFKNTWLMDKLALSLRWV